MAELLGTFELVVLLSVAALGEDAYGRQVLRQVQAAAPGKRLVSAGSVYATLERLQGKRLLASRLEKGGAERTGRPRRFYRITPRGAAAAEYARATLTPLWSAIPNEATV